MLAEKDISRALVGADPVAEMAAASLAKRGVAREPLARRRHAHADLRNDRAPIALQLFFFVEAMPDRREDGRERVIFRAGISRRHGVALAFRCGRTIGSGRFDRAGCGGIAMRPARRSSTVCALISVFPPRRISLIRPSCSHLYNVARV
jgi:hypothetical protein